MCRTDKFQLSVLNTIIFTIDAPIKTGLSINHLSIISGYSKWHLQKIFKHHFGMSLGTYIRRKRIEYASNEIIIK